MPRLGLCTCDTERSDGMSFICVVVGFGVQVRNVRIAESAGWAGGTGYGGTEAQGGDAG